MNEDPRKPEEQPTWPPRPEDPDDGLGGGAPHPAEERDDEAIGSPADAVPSAPAPIPEGELGADAAPPAPPVWDGLSVGPPETAVEEAPEESRLVPDGRLFELDPRVQPQWVIEGLLQTLFLGALAGAADWWWLSESDWWPLPFGFVLGGVAIGSLLLAIFFPRLEYRRWRFAIRPHDVLMQFGVIWQVRRSMPRSRIQHVDIRSGPIERAFGLVKVTLFTAGSGEADATIPGLTPVDAERLREMLLEEEDGVG